MHASINNIHLSVLYTFHVSGSFCLLLGRLYSYWTDVSQTSTVCEHCPQGLRLTALGTNRDLSQDASKMKGIFVQCFYV